MKISLTKTAMVAACASAINASQNQPALKQALAEVNSQFRFDANGNLLNYYLANDIK